MHFKEYIKTCTQLYFFREEPVKKIHEKPLLMAGFLMIVLLSVLASSFDIISLQLLGQDTVLYYLLLEQIPSLTILILAGTVIYVLLTIVLTTLSYAIQHAFLRLLGGKARSKDTLKMGFSLLFLPLAIALLIELVFSPLLIMQSTRVLYFLAILMTGSLSALLFFWTIATNLYVMSKLHRVSLGKSALALALTFLSILVIIICIIISVGIILTSVWAF